MVIKSTKLGGADMSQPSDRLKPQDWNDTFDAAANRISPIGSVVSWLKSFTNTPVLPIGWVECNGQVLSDADSVYNGQTIPNLNGDNRFMRGNSTSGITTSGQYVHSHILTSGGGWANQKINAAGYHFGKDTSLGDGAELFIYEDGGSIEVGDITNKTDNDNGFPIPKSYSVVWIMRVK